MALHEECGVFGIYDKNGDCAQSTYYGLYSLQHRGQEACGIATMNGLEMSCHKDTGLVGDVFSEKTIRKLNGTLAVGHVRYATTGGAQRENVQPLTLSYVKGTFAVAHNGNLVNIAELKRSWEYRGAIFHTTSDTEVISYMIAQERLHCSSIEQAVAHAISKLDGAFSLVIMSSRKLIAARDPWGFRPLCMGRRGDAIIFSSESCALDSLGATFIRDIEPGEVVCVDEQGEIKSINACMNKVKSSLCIFEYLYFARPDSIIDGQSVHEARILAGRYLAKEFPIDADVVIGVPDSGLNAAKGYALESGLPYNDGLIKNRYIGRTFIQPGQDNREMSVKLKLNPLRSTISGKRVVVIDDSIVRGTTSRRLVTLLREAGATEVHLLSSAPPFIAPCYFGTDVPSREELIACNNTHEEMREKIGCDSLGFLSIESLPFIAPKCKYTFCDGCFSGKYPVECEPML